MNTIVITMTCTSLNVYQYSISFDVPLSLFFVFITYSFLPLAFTPFYHIHASNTTHTQTQTQIQRTLWNFSPKHFFTDPSGAYWRERRIHSHDSWWSSDSSGSGLGSGTGGSRSSSGQTLYTDGDNVYESSYRYRDGRNGMHYVSTLQQFLVSSQTGITDKQKQQVLKKLQSKAPDIVVEEL